MRTAFSIVDFRPEVFVSGSYSTIEAPCRFPETCRGWILSSSMTLSMPSKPTKIAAASRNQSPDNVSPARAWDICSVIGKALIVPSFRSHADSRLLDEQRCCRSYCSYHGMPEPVVSPTLLKLLQGGPQADCVHKSPRIQEILKSYTLPLFGGGL